ncbi:MAG: hypothetical protein KF708_13780 [Pirellulales bacterium]|nr:hypothetical protein [Pirellulales bacterium]
MDLPEVATMMWDNIAQFRRKLDAGQFCIGPGISFSDPAASEALVGMADFLWLDLEHTPLSLESLQAHILATRGSGVPGLVRVPTSDVGLIKRVLDTGAEGIIVPQVRSAAEVQAIADHCRYAPLGQRGFGPRRSIGYGRQSVADFLAASNQHLFVAVQIEHVAAYDDLDAILQVEGIDSIVVGPYDLSSSFGVPGEIEHPQVAGAIHSIVERSRRAGRYVGLGMFPDVEQAVAAQRLGVQWVQCGTDWGYVASFADQLYGDIRQRLARSS